MSNQHQTSRNKSSATQSHFKKSNYPAELSLWASVLELAINDYTLGVMQQGTMSDFISAKDWIFFGDDLSVNSFNNICLLFNLDSDSVREILLKDPMTVRFRLSGKHTKG